MRSILTLCLATLGALSGVQPLSAQSPFNSNSLCFDGIDDFVTVPYDASFPVDIFTVAAWVKCTAPTEPWAVIVSRGDDDSSDNAPWELRVRSDGTFQLAIEDRNEVTDIYASNTVIADGSWHHVAATRDLLGLVRLYVDGASVAGFGSSLIPSPLNTQDLSIGCTIGSSTSPPHSFLQGGIDEVAMWSRAKSASQIQSIYQGGPTASTIALRGYWRFDSILGQDVEDSSLDLNHGYLGNDPLLADPADPSVLPSVQAVETIRPGFPPNPNAYLPGQTSGPVIGNKWDPVIDHTSFVPNSILDVFGISLSAVNIPDPVIGTVLCGPTIYRRFRAPGKAFNLNIPNDCIFVGVSLCTSAGSFDPAGNLSLTNAIDITIGSY